MAQSKTNRLILTALLSSMICVCTLVIQIPLPGSGYANLGDGVLLASACLLSPAYAAAAAGIGSVLADILSGYMIYAPGTLLVKSAMGWMVSALCRRYMAKTTIAAVGIFALAELIMTAGYLLYDAFVLSYGMGALASVPGNLLQGAVGMAAGLMLNSVSRTLHKR